MEFLDIVDDNDNVIGREEYSQVYKKNLTHRIAHIIIFNNKGEMALQMRSAEKRFCPGHWCTSAGGHVHSGESYNDAALRETEEELGVRAKMKFLAKDVYISTVVPKKFLATFTARHNGPFNPNPKEVERVEFFSMDEIWRMIREGEKFHPELIFILNKHFK